MFKQIIIVLMKFEFVLLILTRLTFENGSLILITNMLTFPHKAVQFIFER